MRFWTSAMSPEQRVRRWLAAIGVTALGVAAIMLVTEPWLTSPGDVFPSARRYWPGGFTISFFALLLFASPTIFYYRLLIAGGERAWRRLPRLGASLFLLAGALLPPLVQNGLTIWASARRDYVAPPPRALDVVALQDGSRGRFWLSRGLAECNEVCLRLLYGGAARAVIVGDPEPEGGPLPRPASWRIGLVRRAVCPIPTINLGSGATVDVPGGVLIGPIRDEVWRDGLDAAVLGAMAEGRCLAATPALESDATLRLGTRIRDRQDPALTWADRFGLLTGLLAYVDHKAGEAGWSRLSQRTEWGITRHWLIPFTLIPGHRTMIAETRLSAGAARQRPLDERQLWAWAGVRLPAPPAPDRARVRAALDAALALPPGAPADARHAAARAYVAGLAAAPPDPSDRARIARIAADPRFPPETLAPLQPGRHDAAGTGAAPAWDARTTWPRSPLPVIVDLLVLLTLLAGAALVPLRLARPGSPAPPAPPAS